MHFKIDKNNIITEFHIERWDKKALGQKLCDDIESYIHKNYEEFILFALKNKLFLKLRMLFSMNNKETIYFWGCALVHGKNDKNAVEMIVNLGMSKDHLKYAKFYLSEKKEQKILSVLYEACLSSVFENGGYESKKLIFELNDEDIKHISLDFNISRNNRNVFYMPIKNDSENEEKEKVFEASMKKIAFTAIDVKSGALKIITEEEAENINLNDLLTYNSIRSTEPCDERGAGKAKEIMDKINKIINENKNLFPKTQKDKSVFIKIKNLFLYNKKRL